MIVLKRHWLSQNFRAFSTKRAAYFRTVFFIHTDGTSVCVLCGQKQHTVSAWPPMVHVTCKLPTRNPGTLGDKRSEFHFETGEKPIVLP